MKPPKTNKEFEKIPKLDEWINGTIENIEYDEAHKTIFKGEEKVRPSVRFVFKLDGCAYAHRSRWLTFSYGEKSNLYKNFLQPLVDGATPDMELDLDALKGMEIRTMWARNGDYDTLTLIRPKDKKINPGAFTEAAEATEDEEAEEEVPF